MLKHWREGPRRVSPRKGLGPQHTNPHPMPEPLTYFKAGAHVSDDIRVRLNGEPCPMAIEADSKRGWVLVYVIDPATGLIERDGLDPSKPRTRFESGHVEITAG
jgi:hypothetical protein